MEATLVQKLEALVLANVRRAHVASFKIAMKNDASSVACRRAAEILRDEWELVGFMKVHEFLEAIPSFGPARVRKVLTLRDHLIWPLRRVDQLTSREREFLAVRLTGGGLS